MSSVSGSLGSFCRVNGFLFGRRLHLGLARGARIAGWEQFDAVTVLVRLPFDYTVVRLVYLHLDAQFVQFLIHPAVVGFNRFKKQAGRVFQA